MQTNFVYKALNAK